MAKDPNKRPIIIKKVKKVAGGHHGGAWKVAYADFVTAMMAFFLLLWLLAQVPKEKLTGIADYFTPTVGLKEKIGVGLKGAPSDVDSSIKFKPGGTPNVMQGAPPTEGDIAKAPQSNVEDEKEFNGQKTPDQKSEEEIAEELEKKRFEEIKKELNEAIEKSPELQEFKNNLQITQTQEGLQIEITDLGKVSMFEIGSSNLKAETQPLIAKVSEAIQKVNNKVAIIGHTDALNYKNDAKYTNWELSADRANASRRFLVSTGLDQKRLYRVEGKADTEHLVKNDPSSAQNRRISIILLKKSIAPVEGDNTKPSELSPNVGSNEQPATSETPPPATAPAEAPVKEEPEPKLPSDNKDSQDKESDEQVQLPPRGQTYKQY